MHIRKCSWFYLQKKIDFIYLAIFFLQHNGNLRLDLLEALDLDTLDILDYLDYLETLD